MSVHDHRPKRRPRRHDQIVPAFYTARTSLCDCCNDVTLHLSVIDAATGDLFTLALPDEHLDRFIEVIQEQRREIPRLMQNGSAKVDDDSEPDWIPMYAESD